METTWIVTADASRARFLQVAGRDNALTEVEDFVNPEGYDRPGGHSSDGCTW